MASEGHLRQIQADRAVMLLTAIDMAMRTSKNELSSPPPDLSVEHLLPQQGSVLDYPYPPEPEQSDGLSPEMRRARAIHTIGNLTLLTQAFRICCKCLANLERGKSGSE